MDSFKINFFFLISDPFPRIPNNTPSTGLKTPVTSLVPQVSTFPTNSIDSTTITIKPSSATTQTTRPASTAALKNVSSSPGVSSATDPSSTNTKRLSTLVIVLIAVSSGVVAVIIGVAVPCYIWRKRRKIRFPQTNLMYCSIFCIPTNYRSLYDLVLGALIKPSATTTFILNLAQSRHSLSYKVVMEKTAVLVTINRIYRLSSINNTILFNPAINYRNIPYPHPNRPQK